MSNLKSLLGLLGNGMGYVFIPLGIEVPPALPERFRQIVRSAEHQGKHDNVKLAKTARETDSAAQRPQGSQRIPSPDLAIMAETLQ